MKKNIGFTDRAIRLLLALTLISLNVSGVVVFPKNLLLWLVAGILLLTAFLGNCPLYSLLGIKNKVNAD